MTTRPGPSDAIVEKVEQIIADRWDFPEAVRWAVSYEVAQAIAGKVTMILNDWLAEVEELQDRCARLERVADAARYLLGAHSCHLEGSVPLKNALAALEERDG